MKNLFSIYGRERNPVGVRIHDRGFTLVELLIYMGLLAIMVLIFTEIFTLILENQLESKNTSSVSTDGRFIYSRFIYDVNRAESIIYPAMFGSSSATLTLLIGGQEYTYSTLSGNLVITNASESAALNSYDTSISTLFFTKVGTTSANPTIQMRFTLRGLVTQRGIFDEQSFQTTAGLR